MDLTHWRTALAAGALLALPARAQDGPIVLTPPSGTTLLPAGAIIEDPVIAVPPPPAARPGLFGWRRRHADHKRHKQEAFLGFPEEFEERPLGAALYDHGRTQVANGEVARLILNDYDFVGQTAELNFRGRDKLAAIMAQLPASFAPLVIERTPWAPGLAESRRIAILNTLAESPFPVPAERVVVGPSIAHGMRGREAVRVDSSRQTLFYGAGVGGGSASGFDASGLSGNVTAAGVQTP